jgi:hypothetical protein
LKKSPAVIVARSSNPAAAKGFGAQSNHIGQVENDSAAAGSARENLDEECAIGSPRCRQ